MESVLYKIEDGVAIVTLNRPERYNAVNEDIIDGLNNAFDKASEDDNIKCMVINGSGRGCCAGADLTLFGEDMTPEKRSNYIIETYQPLINKFTQSKIPIIGAINGSAAGVGASFALACDFRVMGSSSSIYYAFINIAIGPDGGGSWLLARQVGYSKALEIATSGKKINAEDCYKLGLTNKLVEDDKILEEAVNWAKELAKKPTLAIGITKEDMMFSINNSLHDTIAFEAKKQIIAFKSKDHIEGVTAFVEKRIPNFKGK